MVVEKRLKYSAERGLEPEFSFKSVRDFTTNSGGSPTLREGVAD
jgi:hypothetical protein